MISHMISHHLPESLRRVNIFLLSLPSSGFILITWFLYAHCSMREGSPSPERVDHIFMISIHNLTKRFNGNTAVEDLTLEVKEGELLGLLGPNGAGKTTTVRMLACLVAPTSGSATVCGYAVGRENQEIRNNVGVLTEVPGLYENLTTKQNLQFYARLYGLNDVGTRVEKYLKTLELWDRRDDRAGSLSKGMKQKLALARTLIHEPRVLFLDEPTSGLDPQMARLVRGFVRTLHREGRTILLCTHNLTEAEELCDRVALLRTSLVAVDTPQALSARQFGHSVVVVLDRVDEGILKAVRALDFVEGLQLNGNSLLVALNDPETRNPLLIRRLIEVGANPIYITPRDHSLEDIYLKLIDERPAP